MKSEAIKCDICGCSLPDLRLTSDGKLVTIEQKNKKFHLCDKCLLNGKKKNKKSE